MSGPYYMTNVTESEGPKAPHLGPAVDDEVINRLGVCRIKLPMENGWNEMIRRKSDELGMQNYDVCKISPKFLDKYDEKVKIFFEEHMHTDPEVRYIIDGSGYFDIRDNMDRWIRIPVRMGDFLFLPAGIYHRFTPDEADYIVAVRMFKEAPKWEPLNRVDPSTEQHHARTEYLKLVGSASLP